MASIKKCIIKISYNNVLYNGISYKVYDFCRDVKSIRNAFILVLNSNIYIKKIKIDCSHIDENEIKKIKEAEFGEDEEYLIHYEICRKEKVLFMYAVSCGRIVSSISEKVRNLEVLPIQMCIYRFLKKKISKNNYQCLFFYMKKYYYMSIYNGYIDRCYLWDNIDDANSFLCRNENNNTLYINKELNIKNDNKVVMDFGGLNNEKVFSI